jgi:hypothetical protein
MIDDCFITGEKKKEGGEDFSSFKLRSLTLSCSLNINFLSCKEISVFFIKKSISLPLSFYPTLPLRIFNHNFLYKRRKREKSMSQ